MPAGRGTQEAKGEVCKTSIRRFESAPRLHPLPLSIQPKHRTAKFAEIAKVHQVSTTWVPARRGSAAGGQRLGQNVPVSPTSLSPELIWVCGFSLRPCPAVGGIGGSNALSGYSRQPSAFPRRQPVCSFGPCYSVRRVLLSWPLGRSGPEAEG